MKRKMSKNKVLMIIFIIVGILVIGYFGLQPLNIIVPHDSFNCNLNTYVCSFSVAYTGRISGSQFFQFSDGLTLYVDNTVCNDLGGVIVSSASCNVGNVLNSHLTEISYTVLPQNDVNKLLVASFSDSGFLVEDSVGGYDFSNPAWSFTIPLKSNTNPNCVQENNVCSSTSDCCQGLSCDSGKCITNSSPPQENSSKINFFLIGVVVLIFGGLTYVYLKSKKK